MDPNVVSSFCIFIVLLNCHHSFATESDVTALIKPGTRECFHEYATEGTLLEFEYQVCRFNLFGNLLLCRDVQGFLNLYLMFMYVG